MNAKWSFVLFIVAVALFIGAAFVTDEHIAYGNPAVLVEAGLASFAGAFLVKEL